MEQWSNLRGPGRDTVGGPSDPFGPPLVGSDDPFGPSRPRVPESQPDPLLITHLEAGGSGPHDDAECGAASAVRFMVTGGLALAAGVLLGLFSFWKLVGFGWLA